jgi:DNA-binding helix-hairpin-helix protein with protein kinase domain
MRGRATITRMEYCFRRIVLFTRFKDSWGITLPNYVVLESELSERRDAHNTILDDLMILSDLPVVFQPAQT